MKRNTRLKVELIKKPFTVANKLVEPCDFVKYCSDAQIDSTSKIGEENY